MNKSTKQPTSPMFNAPLGHASKPVYWAITWGDTTRFHGKCELAKDAARYCFGMSTANMKATNLGSRKGEALRQLRQLSLPGSAKSKQRKQA